MVFIAAVMFLFLTPSVLTKAAETITFNLEEESYTYTGSEIQPKVLNVTAETGDQTVELTEDEYTVVYENNVNKGTGSVFIKGKAGTPYSDLTGSVEFEIKPLSIREDCEVSLDKTLFTYTGKAIEPAAAVKVKGSGTLLGKDDYKVSYYNNTNAGLATALVEGTGNTEGEVSMDFSIGKASQNMKASVSPTAIKKGATAQVTVTGVEEGAALTYTSSKAATATVDSQGKVTGKAAGTVTITVKAAETANYKESGAKVTVKVKGKELTKSNTKIKLSKTKYTYNGKKKKPSVTVTYKGKKLTKNKHYKLSYKNNVNAGKAYAVITGTGKFSGTVKKAFKITKIANTMKASISNQSVDVRKTVKITVKKAIGDVTYESGNEKIATVSDKGVVTGKKKGSCKITVRAAGDQNHKASSKTFTVNVGTRSVTDKLCKITLSKTTYVYDGKEKKPTVTVKYNGTTLKNKIHYTVTWANNINAGTGKVIVKGIGKYQGTKTVTFTIAKAEQKDMSVYLYNNRIPYNGTATVTVRNAIGTVTYRSNSPTYASHLGGGRFKGLKKTQNYVTITVTAAGNANYKAKSITIKVTIS